MRQAYADFATGNVPGVLALFDPAIEWRESRGMPYVKCDGIYTGAEAIVTSLFMQLPVFFEGFTIIINELIGAEDKVVMVGYYEGTNKATGNSFKANASHMWTIKDGKLTHFFQVADTATVNS